VTPQCRRNAARKATGLKISYVTADKAKDAKGAIWFGEAAAERAGLVPKGLKGCDCVVAEKDGELYLFGRDRSGRKNDEGASWYSAAIPTVRAVTVFEETFMGVAYLCPGVVGREVPKRERIEWPAGTMSVAAVLSVGTGCLVAFGCGPCSFPIVKKLWSTSFVLIAAGYSLALFALCYWLVDVEHIWNRTLFFRVIGMNALTIYLAQRVVDFTNVQKVLFGWTASWFPPAGGNLVLAIGYIAVCWCFLYVLYRQKMFLKV